MIDPPGDRNGQSSVTSRPSSAGVLADRIAAALIHHEPGWRLPRLTALARRYNVSAAEVDTAIGELTARHLLRRLPDGQVYRASPAEYQVPLAGLGALSSHVDPMGGELTCRSRQVSTRRVPEDTGRALGLAPGETVLVVKCLWLVGGEPGALSATYLPQRLAGLAGDFGGSPLPEPGSGAGEDEVPAAAASQPSPDGAGPEARGQAPGAAGTGPAGEARPAAEAPGSILPGALRATQPQPGLPRAVQVELGPPPPSVARSLRLAAGQSVATVAVRFEDPVANRPIALTMAMLRPDLFRIVVQAPDDQPLAGRGGGLASTWTHAAEGWEP